MYKAYMPIIHPWLIAFGPAKALRTLAVILAWMPALAAASDNLPMVALGPNDLISVTVYGNSDLSRAVRIASDGMLRLPLLEAPIGAAGKLPAELAVAIAAAFRNEQVLVEPEVTVTVGEYASRQVTIGGAVKNPITVQAIVNMTVNEAIARAGGLAPDAGPEILIRMSPGDQAESVRRISVKELTENSTPAVNFLLHGGEEVMVPQAPRIYVVGNVQRPGAFSVTDSPSTSVLKAIALAQGLAPYASKQAFILRLDPGRKERLEVRVSLAQLLDRKTADVPLQADDILYVPDNKTKRVSAGVIDRLVGFGSNTTSGLLIWRR